MTNLKALYFDGIRLKISNIPVRKNEDAVLIKVLYAGLLKNKSKTLLLAEITNTGNFDIVV